MKRKLMILIILIVSNNMFIYAENQSKADSLIQQISIFKQDSNLVNHLMKIFALVYQSDPRKGLQYCFQALEVSKKEKYLFGEARSLNNISVGYTSISEFDSAIIYAKKSLEISIKNNFSKTSTFAYHNLARVFRINGDFNKAIDYYKRSFVVDSLANNKLGMAKTWLNIGVVYDYKGDFNKALHYYNLAKDSFSEQNNQVEMASVYGNIGIIYYYKGKYSDALKALLFVEEIGLKINNKGILASAYKNIGIILHAMGRTDKEVLNYYLKSLKIEKELGNKIEIASSLLSIGVYYHEMGAYDSAMIYYQKSLDLYIQINNKSGLALASANIGDLKAKQKRYTEAESYFLKALAINEEIGNPKQIAATYNDLGEVSGKLKHPQQAIEYLSKGIIIAKKSEYIRLVQDANLIISEVYADIHDYENAYNYYLKYTRIKDSLFSIEKVKEIEEIHTKYEAEKKDELVIRTKKEKELIQESKEVQLKWFIGSLFAFLFVSIVIIFMIRKNHKYKTLEQKAIIEKQKIEKRQRKAETEKEKILLEKKLKEKEQKEQIENQIRNSIIKNNKIIINFKEGFEKLKKSIGTNETTTKPFKDFELLFRQYSLEIQLAEYIDEGVFQESIKEIKNILHDTKCQNFNKLNEENILLVFLIKIGLSIDELVVLFNNIEKASLIKRINRIAKTLQCKERGVKFIKLIRNPL